MNVKGFLLKYGKYIVPATMLTIAALNGVGLKGLPLFLEGMGDNC